MIIRLIQIHLAKKRYVSETGDQYDSVREFMKENGWNYKEQMGSGLVFEKNYEITIIETRQYSKYYYINQTKIKG